MLHWFQKALLIPLSVISVCLGCGSSAPFDYTPVTGALAYDDGSVVPAKGIVLQFVTLDVAAQGKSHPRPAAADLNDDGSFPCATSYKYGDGLVPGKHKVAIYYATDAKGNLLVPKEYTLIDTTPLVVDSSETPLTIKVPKPKK